MEGDITDPSVCEQAMQNIDVVCHQAALGSVPRSIKTPILTFQNNINGFINILDAARLAGVKKMVYASSSSVYGDANYHPKVEERIGKVLSPYAASKHTNEIIAEAYAKNYDMQISGFRYFNVFGPRQDPNGPYAAVIPLFIKHAIQNTSPTINGDGSISRDYTFVSNVVKANLNAMSDQTNFRGHEVFNIACGATTTLLELWHKIKNVTNSKADAILGPERTGDILHSLANVSKAASLINYTHLITLDEGLFTTIKSYNSQNT
jgi:UDP-N-acetylglucosamine 4-epimerase